MTPEIAAHQVSLSFTISWNLLKLMSIESVKPPNHLILCLPLLLPSNFPSIRVFYSESALHIMWPKYCSFSFSIIYIYIHTHHFRFFSLIDYYKILSRVLCAINRYLLAHFSSVQFRCSVVSDSLRPHESQHTRPPCPSPAPGVYSNSCPLSQ